MSQQANRKSDEEEDTNACSNLIIYLFTFIEQYSGHFFLWWELFDGVYGLGQPNIMICNGYFDLVNQQRLKSVCADHTSLLNWWMIIDICLRTDGREAISRFAGPCPQLYFNYHLWVCARAHIFCNFVFRPRFTVNRGESDPFLFPISSASQIARWCVL